MDADQAAIFEYLKSWPGQFVSRREICRRARGKCRYREDEHWAVPVLQRMLESRLVEADDTGHFRLMKHGPTDPRNKKRLWLSPAIRSILKQSGRDFAVIDLDKEPDTAEQMASAEPVLAYHSNPQNRAAEFGGSVPSAS